MAVEAESEVDADDSEAIEEGIPHRWMEFTVKIEAAIQHLLHHRSWFRSETVGQFKGS